MNHTEANDVLEEIKAMFPDWTVWARSLPDVPATARVWTKSLMTQDKRDVLDIIDEYTTGKRKAPTSYEYERLIFGIVAAAREIRDKDTQRSEQQQRIRSWHDEQDAAAKRRSSYKPSNRNMMLAMVKFKNEVERIERLVMRSRGNWTKEDHELYRESCKEIEREFLASESRGVVS